MVLYLTSSPTGDLNGDYVPDGFDPRNGFLEDLRSHWIPYGRCLMITAFPDDIPASEEMTEYFRSCMIRSGLTFSAFDLWDCRTVRPEKELLHSYDLVFLGGGHVPTQLAFFRRLNLRELFEGFRGIVVGISAGTMDCADWVYAEPEEDGEAVDPNYKRWERGLGLTDIHILPHHQLERWKMLDGMRLFEDIVFPDSMGNVFISIPDGSYIRCENGEDHYYGEYHVIENGIMTRYEGEQ